ncbi:MAG: DUF3108 domain-containing protein [Oricola sp.]
MTVAAAIFLVSILACLPSRAETRIYRAEYAVSALGLPVGMSRFETAITPRSYTLSGTLKARGLAALFAPTTGSLAAEGRIGRDRVEARTFSLDYVTGGRKQRTEIGFARGAVTRTLNAPEVKKEGGWIEVEARHLSGALDPISALLVPAASARSVCNRTVRVFDGAMRADVKLTYLRTVPFRTAGFKGDAVTCRARFLPVSGYPKGKSEIAWMRDKSRIDIAFAPIAGTGLFAPVSARIGTQIGPVTIYATRFESVTK